MNSRSNAPPLSPKRRWRLQLHPTLAPTHGLLSACFYLCLLVYLRLSLCSISPSALRRPLCLSLSASLYVYVSLPFLFCSPSTFRRSASLPLFLCLLRNKADSTVNRL